jgi:hypothetical protein
MSVSAAGGGLQHDPASELFCCESHAARRARKRKDLARGGPLGEQCVDLGGARESLRQEGTRSG